MYAIIAGMAKAKKQVSFEDALWGACDKLRGTVEPAEYKHVVLSLIFLKFVNDKFDARWNGYSVPPTSSVNYGWILHMVSKLSTNGTAGFLLANGALSGEGQELEIRKQLIENNFVEAIVILPRNLFYTTDISVTLWILNKNKKSRTVEHNGKIKNYRNREDEVLFMDLRQMGSPFEKKYIELTQEDRDKVTSTFHAWQQAGANETYKDIPEFCYSANKKELLGVFKDLGYEIKL